MRAAVGVEAGLAQVPDRLGEQRAAPRAWAGQLLFQLTRNSPGLMYSERMVARPLSEAVSCGSPAGSTVPWSAAAPRWRRR